MGRTGWLDAKRLAGKLPLLWVLPILWLLPGHSGGRSTVWRSARLHLARLHLPGGRRAPRHSSLWLAHIGLPHLRLASGHVTLKRMLCTRAIAAARGIGAKRVGQYVSGS